MIDILVSYDLVYDCIYKSFFKSTFNQCKLKQHYTVIENKIDIDNTFYDKMGFLTPRHIFCKQQQLIFALSHIDKQLNLHNHNNYGIVSDTDIIFFPGFHDAIRNVISHNNDTDIFFMSENENKTLPNPGFFLFKYNENSFNIIEQILNIYIESNDSTLTNISSMIMSLLKHNNALFDILDLDFMNNNYLAASKLSSSIACFHSTSTFNILDKANNLNSMMKKTRSLFGFFNEAKGIDSNNWKKLLQNNIGS